jgi:hypothetical protein
VKSHGLQKYRFPITDNSPLAGAAQPKQYERVQPERRELVYALSLSLSLILLASFSFALFGRLSFSLPLYSPYTLFPIPSPQPLPLSFFQCRLAFSFAFSTFLSKRWMRCMPTTCLRPASTLFSLPTPTFISIYLSVSSAHSHSLSLCPNKPLLLYSAFRATFALFLYSFFLRQFSMVEGCPCNDRSLSLCSIPPPPLTLSLSLANPPTNSLFLVPLVHTSVNKPLIGLTPIQGSRPTRMSFVHSLLTSLLPPSSFISSFTPFPSRSHFLSLSLSLSTAFVLGQIHGIQDYLPLLFNHLYFLFILFIVTSVAMRSLIALSRPNR